MFLTATHIKTMNSDFLFLSSAHRSSPQTLHRTSTHTLTETPPEPIGTNQQLNTHTHTHTHIDTQTHRQTDKDALVFDDESITIYFSMVCISVSFRVTSSLMQQNQSNDWAEQAWLKLEVAICHNNNYRLADKRVNFVIGSVAERCSLPRFLIHILWI